VLTIASIAAILILPTSMAVGIGSKTRGQRCGKYAVETVRGWGLRTWSTRYFRGWCGI